jgi:hypothetical protein
MIPKPDKDPVDIRPIRPNRLISLLSILFEKLLLQKLMPAIAERNLIPNYQFSFRSKHTTIKQIHRIANKITLAFEAGKYCSAMFLDVSQVFDRVEYDDLLFKIQEHLPKEYFAILNSNLNKRYFFIKQ